MFPRKHVRVLWTTSYRETFDLTKSVCYKLSLLTAQKSKAPGATCLGLLKDGSFSSPKQCTETNCLPFHTVISCRYFLPFYSTSP